MSYSLAIPYMYILVLAEIACPSLVPRPNAAICGLGTRQRETCPLSAPTLGNANIEVVQARRGEPGIFYHVRSEKAVDATRGNCAWAYETQNRKGTKVAGNLLHVSNYRTSNNIHTIIG